MRRCRRLRRRRWTRRWRRRRGRGRWSCPAPTTSRSSSAARSIETKPLKIVGDPELQTDAGRKHATDIAMDLHEIQKRGQPAADALDVDRIADGRCGREGQGLEGAGHGEGAVRRVRQGVRRRESEVRRGARRGGGAGGWRRTRRRGWRGRGAAGAAGRWCRRAGGAAPDPAAQAGGGGGRRGGGAPDPNNVLGRVSTLKGDLDRLRRHGERHRS